MAAKNYRIKELLEMSDGTLLTGTLKAKITKLWPRKEGDRQDGGKWSFQSLVLKDATGEIKVSLKDLETSAPPGWLNREMMLLAKKGAKGWSGLKVVAEEYVGKDSKKHSALALRVTPSAEILCDGKNLRDLSGESSEEENTGSGEGDSEQEETSQEESETLESKAPEPAAPEPAAPEPAAPEPAAPEPAAPEPAQNKNLAKRVDATEYALIYLGRQSSLLRLAADAQLRTIVSFLSAHKRPVGPAEITGYTDAIAKEMTKTAFSTLYISCKGIAEDENLPPIHKLDSVMAALAVKLKAKA